MRQIAERFTVSLTFVFDLIENFKQNGHTNPKPRRGWKALAINKEEYEFLHEIVDKNSDMASKELCQHYEHETGKKVSKTAMDRTSKKMNMTRKKKVLLDPKKTLIGSNNLRKSIWAK